MKDHRQRSGRGTCKPSYLVSPTAKLRREVTLPRLESLGRRLGPRFAGVLGQPLSAHLSKIQSPDASVRGLALEALVLSLMRLLDMEYVATPLRASAAEGNETRLLFQSDRLVFSRWQVQCKNTARVALDDVAKEVGLTRLLKSNVIVMVTTGEIGPAARNFANKMMAESNQCVVMLDKTDLKAIEASPVAIVDAFNREAANAMRLKKLEL